MIFVTLGSQKYQFNRLLAAIDDLIEKGYVHEDVFAQVGYSDYQPKHFRYKQFLNADEFEDYLSQCDLMIAHAGTGTIVKAVKKGKKVIVAPRLQKYREHEDNHQQEIAEMFKGMGMICVCEDFNDLPWMIEQAKAMQYEPYVSNTQRIIESIEDYIQRET